MHPANTKNQAAHERVNRLVIGPMRSLFNAKIDEYAEGAFLEDLCRFSEECLTESMQLLRRSKKRAPALGDIIQTAIEVEERQSEKKGTTFVMKQHQEFPKEAEEIMRSEFGQMALREGWGHSLFIKTFRTGFCAWRDSDAVDFRSARLSAIDAACFAETRSKPNPNVNISDGLSVELNRHLLSVFHGMEAKEKTMREKYLKPTETLAFG